MPCGEPVAALGFVAASPRQQHGEASLREVRDQRAPVRLGPELVGAAGRVHEDRIRRLGRGGQRRRDQVEARRSVGRVAESRRGELPAAVDQMLRRIDPVRATIGPARRGLADAGAIGAVHRPAREPRHQRALDLLLQIEHQRRNDRGSARGEMPRLRARSRGRGPRAASGAAQPE